MQKGAACPESEKLDEKRKKMKEKVTLLMTTFKHGLVLRVFI